MPAKISEKAAKNMPLGAHLGAKIGQVGAKMALCCPTWRQDGPKMANLKALEAILESLAANMCLQIGAKIASAGL